MLKLIAGLALLLASGSSAATFSPLGFALSGVNRFVTPNNDGKNDEAFFRYNNTQGVAGTIRVFELKGRHVATVDMDPLCISPCTVSWNPKGFTSGVYIYTITIGASVLSGSLVVVK